jgi:tetratricopeptide (TPR) repeat protein
MIGKEKLRTLLVCLALTLGTALLYWPVVTLDYVTLDDGIYLMNNFHVNRGFTWEGLRWCFTTSYASMWHPLTWVSCMLDCQLYHRWLGGHHATNLVLHILSALMLFLLLNRMTRAFWRSAMVTALFAWHPLHVESVAWLSERKDVLCTVFWMLTLWAYLRYAEECKMQSAKRKRFYVLALVFFVLGLMSKPMLVTLPFVLLLLDWRPLRRMQLAPPSAREMQNAECRMQNKGQSYGSTASRPAVLRLLIEKIPFFVLSIIFSVLAVKAAGLNAVSLASFPFPHRLGNAVVSYFIYVAKTIWPQNLVAIYSYDVPWETWQIVAACLFLIAVSAAALRFWKTRPYLLVGWLWFLGTLVPVLGLVRVGAQSMADRYTYIPSIGLFILFIWGACDLGSGWRQGPVLLGGLAWVALVACVLLAGKQIQYWRNGETLFAHNLEVDPDNFIAQNCYAAYFLANGQLERARVEDEKSLRLNPNYDLAHAVLGEVFLLQGNYDQAAPELAAALQLNPTSGDARVLYAKALLGQDHPAEAEQQFAQVLAADPVVPEAHYGLGQALAKLGKPDEACAQFTEALRLAPQFSDARLQLAIVLAKQGKTSDAISHYRLAKDVPPSASDVMVMNNLAWILAASPYPELRNGAEAVKLAARACELDRSQQPMLIGTLAAAYAEAGRYDEAVAAAQQAHDLALKLAGNAHDAAEEKTAKDLAARNLELLELYRSRHPYHEK